MFTVPRLAAAVATAAAVTVLTVPAASAGDAPVPGTPDCTKAVEGVQAVIAARADLAAGLDATPALTADAIAALRATLAANITTATKTLCTGTVTTSPEPTTTTPTTTTTPPVGDVKDCNDFTTQAEAQRYYDAVRTDDRPDPSRLDLDGDGRACEPNEGAGIDPTKDDGSDTGGSQVVDVPSGSASTGD